MIQTLPASCGEPAQATPDVAFRKPRAGRHHRINATDFLGNVVEVEVHAQLCPAHISTGAPCSVFVSARVPGLSVSLPDMTAKQAYALAQALCEAADEADEIDGVPVGAL